MSDSGNSINIISTFIIGLCCINYAFVNIIQKTDLCSVEFFRHSSHATFLNSYSAINCYIEVQYIQLSVFMIHVIIHIQRRDRIIHMTLYSEAIYSSFRKNFIFARIKRSKVLKYYIFIKLCFT